MVNIVWEASHSRPQLFASAALQTLSRLTMTTGDDSEAANGGRSSHSYPRPGTPWSASRRGGKSLCCAMLNVALESRLHWGAVRNCPNHRFETEQRCFKMPETHEQLWSVESFIDKPDLPWWFGAPKDECNVSRIVYCFEVCSITLKVL